MDICKQLETLGYAVVKNFVASSEIDKMRTRASELVEQFDPGEYRSMFHSLFDESKSKSDNYILNSADKIRFFLEEKGISEDGLLNVSKKQSICKIGHALHDLDPVFDEFSRSDKIERLVNRLGFQKPLLAQSMFFYKNPKVSAEIGLHQDASFIYTVPSSVMGLWFALEDATVENSCLRVLPGGHKDGLHSRFVTNSSGEFYKEYESQAYPKNKFIPLEVKKGDLVILHGLLPHYSEANNSDRSREAYTLHVIEGMNRYPENNWIQRSSALPFRGF